MRQNLGIVNAVNFGDLMMLFTQTGVVLEILRYMAPSEDAELQVKFQWEKSAYRVSMQSLKENKERTFNTRPNGVSMSDWAQLVFEVLRGHLQSSSRFRVKEVLGDSAKGLLVFYLIQQQ